MPSTKPKQPPPGQGPSFADPLADLLVSPGAAVDDPSTAAPGPDTPGPDDDDDDEDEIDDVDPDTRAVPMPAQAGPLRTSRRGFLGTAAGLIGAAAASAAAPPGIAQAATAPPLLPPPPAVGGMTPEMAQMAHFFTQLMDQREGRLLDELDRRVSAIRAELPVPNGVVHAESPAELAHRPGQYPPSMVLQQPSVAMDQGAAQFATRSPGTPGLQSSSPWPTSRQSEAQAQARRMVAFIPKEDSRNPRQTMFRGWVNGRELRARRGQIMIVSLGTGVDWAKNGHGNCVDIAAMQGVGTVEPMRVPQAPDLSRPSNWDGTPLSDRSSIPVFAQ